MIAQARRVRPRKKRVRQTRERPCGALDAGEALRTALRGAAQEIGDEDVIRWVDAVTRGSDKLAT